MKQWKKLMMLLSVLTLSGCALLNPDPSAVVMFGKEEVIRTTMSDYSSDVEKRLSFSVKKETLEGRTVIYIPRPSMEALVTERLIYTLDRGKAKPLKKIESNRNRQSFAKKAPILPKELYYSTTYEGEIAIGKEPLRYADVVVMLDQGAYDEIEGAEETMEIVRFKNDALAHILPKLEENIAVESVQAIE